jgi:hypothetical protein
MERILLARQSVAQVREWYAGKSTTTVNTQASFLARRATSRAQREARSKKQEARSRYLTFDRDDKKGNLAEGEARETGC